MRLRKMKMRKLQKQIEHDVCRNDFHLDPRECLRLVMTLSKSQLRILWMLMLGRTAKEIGKEMGLQARDVNHRIWSARRTLKAGKDRRSPGIGRGWWCAMKLGMEFDAKYGGVGEDWVIR